MNLYSFCDCFSVQVEGATSPTSTAAWRWLRTGWQWSWSSSAMSRPVRPCHSARCCTYKGTPALTRRDWWKVAKDLVLAVQYVHNQGHLLNDLKEDNVLLSRSDGNVWRAVIIDFGWVCHQSEPAHFGFSLETKEKYTREKLFDHIAPECALLDEGTSTLSDVYTSSACFCA